MAHFSVHVDKVRRSLGRNAIAAAAYISRSKLSLTVTDKETNISVQIEWDHSKKGGIAYSKISAPEHAPEWVYDRQTLWNKAEQAENRCDANTAGTIMLALPKEFSEEQNIELVEDIVSGLVKRGMVVDANIHKDKGDNKHAHLQLTERELVENRYGEMEFSRLKNRDWQGPVWTKAIRTEIAEKINYRYMVNGFDLQVSHKSYKELGIDMEPGVHEGPARNIKNAELVELNRQIALENAEKIKEKPGIILDVLGINNPVFTKEQIATELEKRLHAGIDFAKIDNIESLQSELSATFIRLYEQILVCPEISQIVEADLKGRTLYTTTKRLELEERFTDNVKELHSRNNHVLNINDSDLDHLSWSEKIGAKLRDVKTGLIENINDKTGLKLEKPRQEISLSKEQRRAVVNVLNGSDISVLEGIPGAGKTTVMREMVRQYKKAGFKVIGVAPSSAASLELAKATGIECKNASLWRKEWLKEQGKKFELVLRGDYYKEDLYKDNGSSLTKKHVMIIDEASMGEMANMDYLISEARAAGAKVLKAGDSNQLSPVGWAGALAKTISICGSETLSESRRQQQASHQEATRLLSQYRVRDALDIYWKEGLIKVARNESEANSMAVRSFVNSYIETAKALGKDDLVSIRSKAIPVFKNETRELLNNQVREQLKEAGILKGREHRVLVGSVNRDGKYEKQYLNLQRGEQIVFARNANRLGADGIFNGELGTILKIHKPNKDALAKIDILVHKANGKCEKVSLDLQELASNKYTGRYFHDGVSIDYGYAVTSHKVQGASIQSTIPRFEKGTGYEVGNVILTRHKEDMEIVVSKEVLYDAFYEALDETAGKARNRFDIKGEAEETILKGGLAKMLSKRSNTSFASDYRTMGQTEEDRYIKHYIDKSEETIATVRKITSWQNIEHRRTGAKPEMWEHRDWQEFLERRKERSLAASTIMVGFAPNGKLAGDAREEYSHLTSTEFRKECLSASYAKFKDRIVQLGMNYATIEKHASQLGGKGSELDKVTVDQKITILHEQDIFKELVQSVSSGQTIAIRNSYRDVNLHIAETTLAIEEKSVAIAEIEDHRQELTDAIETETHYRKILTPEYLNRIYHTFKGTKEDAGSESLGLYQKMVMEHGEAKATKMVVKDPTKLGALKGYGVGRLFGLGNARKDAIALCQNLEKQLQGFNRSGKMIEQYKKQMAEADFGTKLFKLSEEIEYLRSLLPADIDKEFVQEVESKLQRTKSNNIDWRDLQKSELFETVRVGQYATKERSIFNQDDFVVVEQVVPKESQQLTANAVVAEKQATETKTTSINDIEPNNVAKNIDTKEERDHVDKEHAAIIANLPDNELKDQFKQKVNIADKHQQQENNKLRLTFKEVKAGLNQSVVSEIFRHYGPMIVANKPVEKKGSQLKIGSLYMSMAGNKAGLWNRFSDGSKGDIFSFVEEATGRSKYEALEIVASHAGIVASCVNNKFKDGQQSSIDIGKEKGATRESSAGNGETGKNTWIAYKLVPDSASGFNPEKDLSFLIKQGNAIILTHEYKNKENQLLGYVVRIEDKEGKKQVLPVAYCHNEAKAKSRWQLKGFSDAETKPIYGIEKLAKHPEKPILIVEGEKTADAASILLPDHNVISWMGGAQGFDKVDWSKLSNRVVSIWPDNDKPGIEAAKNIANHIDCHNGFSGLVSIVDTEKLGLPKKWDLADALPEEMKHVNPEEIMEHARNNSGTGKQLEMNQEQVGIKAKNTITDSINMLVATGRLDKDEYISRAIYHDSLMAIANSRNMDLGKIRNHKDFVDAISSLQDEYKSLNRSYEQNILKEQGIEGSSASKGKSELSTREQLAHDLIRDTSVLHQVSLGQARLTATHSEHIEKAVNAEISKMQRFTDSDKEQAANNIYKVVNSTGWRDQLDAANLEKTSNIITLGRFKPERQLAKTPNEIMNVIIKEQEFLVGLHDNSRYAKNYGSEVQQSIIDAKDNKENGVCRELGQALEANQKQGIRSDEELASILQNPEYKVSEIYEYLHDMAKNTRHESLKWYSHEISSLKKMDSKIDYDNLVNTLSSMSTEDRKEYINALTAVETKKYVEPLLASHREEKAKATNASELMAAIAKEQTTYVHLHNDHAMAIYALDKSNGNMNLSMMASAANDIHNLGGIAHVQKAIDHAIVHNIRTENKIFDDLRNSEGNLKILSEDLHGECANHHRDQVDRHIEDLGKNRTILIDHQRFSDPGKYLHHIKEYHNHDFMPIDHINKQLQRFEHKHEQEMQKDLHLNKSMGGPSL